MAPRQRRPLVAAAPPTAASTSYLFAANKRARAHTLSADWRRRANSARWLLARRSTMAPCRSANDARAQPPRRYLAAAKAPLPRQARPLGPNELRATAAVKRCACVCVSRRPANSPGLALTKSSALTIDSTLLLTRTQKQQPLQRNRHTQLSQESTCRIVVEGLCDSTKLDST